MATNQPLTQVQLKGDFTKTFYVPSKSTLTSLAPSSLRLSTVLFGLSVSNQAYAIGGSALHWWDIFPVPPSLPEPYNDSSQYGILCGWGYARVLESTIDSVRPGQLVRGFVPFSTSAYDLQLGPAVKVDGHFLATSPHRAQAMPLYQRYIVHDDLDTSKQADLDWMAYDSVISPLWECSFLLNKFTFATQESPAKVHPAGEGLPWSNEQSNIGAATVICLAASGKTSMAFASELNRRQGPDSGPFAIIGVTSAQNVDYVKESRLYSAVLTYEEARANDSRALVANLNINTNRVVMLDFGARGTFTQDVQKAFQTHGNRLPPLTTLRIGFENKSYSAKELGELFKLVEKTGMVQMNASGLREQVIRDIGEETYFGLLEDARDTFFDSGSIPGLQLRWGTGMKGEEGLEGIWDSLCKGRIDPREGIVIKL